MHIHRRQEVHDFRDKEPRPLDVTTSPSFPSSSSSPTSESTRDNIKKGIAVFGKLAIVGLTVYHLYIIGGWLSDWYAKKRAERYGHWKRDHMRQWNFEGAEVVNSGE